MPKLPGIAGILPEIKREGEEIVLGEVKALGLPELRLPIKPDEVAIELGGRGIAKVVLKWHPK